MKKTIFDLELHEDLITENERTIIKRVSGGWLYTSIIVELGQFTTVFVPYSDELDEVEEAEMKYGDGNFAWICSVTGDEHCTEKEILNCVDCSKKYYKN